MSDSAKLTALPGGEAPRIGVYACHCGTNIAATIDVAAVAEYGKTLPNVVLSREYKYMCSDPGQAMIRDDIKAHNLNRIVVAACSPCLHEGTFRGATASGGINPFFFQMVNVREHASWVHTDKNAATDKAKDLVRAAVRRVQYHKALERPRVDVDATVLVVGGGIAGIHAALTAANAGKKVYLVEREASIGGHMAQFDKTFPTLDCAACILTPKMTDVAKHPNITLYTLAEVDRVDGYVGNFDVTIRHKPRYVIDDLCIGCSACIDACIYKEGKFTDEFNVGLSKRKPVYLPFPQAVPQLVVFDPETCIELKTGKCKKSCVEACGERNAIDLKQKERKETIRVGAIVLATGFDVFDAKRVPEYGYGAYPGVYTSLEIERLVNASGPTEGKVVMRNGKIPKRIGIVHCVGSRDLKTNKYCSRVCCMYALKLAHLLKEKTEAEVYEFYIDMRTPGKLFEEFYNRVAEEGVHFIRGKVASVRPGSTKDEIVAEVEDTLAGMVREIPLDMLVLSVGLEAQKDADEVRRRFNIGCSKEGFFTEKHPKLAPVNTMTDGIFLAGSCQGPKDIPDTVAQAGAAAAEALAMIDKGFIEMEPNTAYVVEEECSGCKTCLTMCPYTAISRDEAKKVAVINPILCKGCGTCVAACPTGSIVQNLFEEEMIMEEIRGVMNYA
jgi:heterodisulfide reductase subunit A